MAVRGVPAFTELREPSGQTFDPHQVHHVEPDRGDLLSELLGMMEVGGREPVLPVVGVAMLAFSQVALDDGLEPWVEEEAPGQAVEQGCESADGRHRHHPARSDHASRLGQRPEALGSIGEVVEGPEEQHAVDTGVRLTELSGVAELGGHPEGPELLGHRRHVPGCEVDHVDLVAVRRQPRSMDTGGAADIEDAGRGRREVVTKDLLGPEELQLAQPGGDAVLFTAGLVVPGDRLDTVHPGDDIQGIRDRPPDDPAGAGPIDRHRDRSGGHSGGALR
jgi:hypothetical protein